MLSVAERYSGIEILNLPATVTVLNFTGSGRKNKKKEIRDTRMSREMYRTNLFIFQSTKNTLVIQFDLTAFTAENAKIQPAEVAENTLK